MTITDDDGQLRTVPALTIDDVMAAEGDSVAFTVTLSLAVPGGLTVTPSFTDGTATSGTDYTPNTAALTFTGTAGETQTFKVATGEDAVVEADETFTVGLSVSGATETVEATDTGTGTITDDNGSAAVTIENASANEGDTITFTVALDKALQGGLTVTPSYTDGTATEGTDYTANTAALTFAGTAGETVILKVATTQDALVEPDETFTVSLSVSGTTALATATDTGTGTVTNDDTASTGITISVDPATVAEDAGATTVTVTATLNAGALAADTAVTVAVGASADTATEGTDYATVNDLTMTIAAGNTADTATFALTPTDDDVVEGSETLSVSGSGTNLAVTNATITITDDDGSAAVTIGDAASLEGDTITFTVTLDRAVQGGLTITPNFADGTATSSTDYTANTTALTFSGTEGETRMLKVATTEDTLVESDETFTVSLAASGTAAPIAATDTGTGTIVDDDGTAAVTLTVTPTSVAENAGATTVTVTATMTGGTRPDTTGVTVAVGAAGDGATEGTDYATVNDFTVTVPAGSTRAQGTFTLTPADDSDVEGDEALSVSGSATGLSTRGATVTIEDDEENPGRTVPALTIDDATVAEGDSLAFTVRLNRAVSGGLTVTPSFTDGTATSGTDYTPNTAALTFTGTAAETQTFKVATGEDAVVEPDETFTVGLSVSGTTEPVTARDTGTGTIADDDGTAVVTIDDASAAEGDSITFTVTLDRAVQGGLTVTPSFTDGTAAEAADYTANTAALTFAGHAGETQRVKVATAEDTIVEDNETFTVGLALSGTMAPVTATDSGTGMITDDDGGAAVTIADASAAEGDSITFTVTLARAVQGGLTVTPSFTNGTAASTDYTANTAALTFAGNAGETQSVKVATTEDAVVEGDETFTVSLAVSGTSETVTATDKATGTITDDDGTAAVTIGDASANEGDTLTFAVTLDKSVQGGLTVTPSFTNGTAASTDYTANTAPLTFTGSAGETHRFKVATTEDAQVESDETFTVSLSVSGTKVPATATDTATGTITNDDTASTGITLSVAPGSVAEDAGVTTVTVTATLNDAARSAATPVTVVVGASTDAACGRHRLHDRGRPDDVDRRG